MTLVINYKEKNNLIIAVSLLEVGKEVNINKIIKSLGQVEDNLWVQLVNTYAVFSIKHLLLSSYISLKKYLNKELITQNPHIELLVTLTAKRQIKEALRLAGISETVKEVFLVVLAVNKPVKHVIEVLKFFIENHGLKEKDISKFTYNMEAPLICNITSKEIESTIGLSSTEKIEKNVLMKVSSVYLKP